MKFLRRAILLTVAIAALQGCAPYMGSCSWVVPEAGTALKVVEARKPISSECNCINCKAPGRFVIQREGYTLEMWNGDRWYTHLYARARDRQGAMLTLAADSPEFLRMAPHVSARDTNGFEYFMRFSNGEETVTSLRITILDAKGYVLGIEDLKLRVETRTDISIEYI